MMRHFDYGILTSRGWEQPRLSVIAEMVRLRLLPYGDGWVDSYRRIGLPGFVAEALVANGLLPLEIRYGHWGGVHFNPVVWIQLGSDK